MTYLSDLDTSKTIKAEVLNSERITPDDVAEVRSIHLAIKHPDFSYKEGQHVGVIAPGSNEFGHDKHFRLYTIANSPQADENNMLEIELCVRRCSYLDEFSGEEEPGLASNYLCDLRKGDSIALSGPYGEAFSLPTDPGTNLLMIGSGTGIAPFRAFIQHIYQKQSKWDGKVILFYGARSGTETLYRNELKNDMDEYYDEKSFQAFEGLSSRPWMHNDDMDGLNNVLKQNANEIWELIQDPKTHVYLAGLDKTKHNFEQLMSVVSGSNARWRWMLEEMKEQDRWSELLYG